MREKIKVPMEYKVLYEDSNAKSIEWLNVFAVDIATANAYDQCYN